MRKRKRMKIIKKVLLHPINDVSELNRYARERIEKDIFFYKPKNIYFKLNTTDKSPCDICCMRKYCSRCSPLGYNRKHYLNCWSSDYFEEISEIETLVLIGD